MRLLRRIHPLIVHQLHHSKLCIHPPRIHQLIYLPCFFTSGLFNICATCASSTPFHSISSKSLVGLPRVLSSMIVITQTDLVYSFVVYFNLLSVHPVLCVRQPLHNQIL